MYLKERHVQEEPLLCLGPLADEDDRALRDLLVAVVLGIQIEHTDGLYRPAFHARPHLRLGIPELTEERVRRVTRFVRGVLDPEPLVEALVGRQSPPDLTQVPLAEGRGRVTRVGEQLGQRVLPRREPVVAPRQRHHRRP